MDVKKDGAQEKNFSEKLLDYIVKNPFLVLWNIAAIIGGLVGYYHYLRVGYLPEVDIKSMGTILVALALTGVLMTGLLTVTFCFPAIYLRGLFKSKTDGTLSPEIELKCIRASGLVMLITAVNGVGLAAIVLWLFSEKKFQLPDAQFVLLGTILVTLACMARWRLRSFHEYYRDIGKFIYSSFVWMVSLLLLSLYLIGSVISNDELSTTGKVLITILFFAVIIFSNIGLAVKGAPNLGRTKLFINVGLAIAPVFIFLVIVSSKFSLETEIFSRLGLGRIEHSFFLVTPQACNALNVVRENTCLRVSDARLQREEQRGCVRPTYLENRIGTEYLLVYPIPVERTSSRRRTEISIPLKKTDVLIWAFGETVEAGNHCLE